MIVGSGFIEVFDAKNLSVVVFDDADVVSTHSLLQEHLLRRLTTECQLFFLANCNKPTKIGVKNDVVEECLLIDGSIYPRHIDNFYITCKDIKSKVEAIQTMCLKAYEENAFGKILVYFSVSIFDVTFCVSF